jgi:hypothetical protein
MPDSVTVMSPALCLGVGGIKPEAFQTALDADPDVIAVDGGSLDFGPYYLATGECFVGRGQVKEDLKLILPGAAKKDIPTIIGTAGGSGATPHVEETFDIITEVVDEHDLEVDVAVLRSDIETGALAEQIQSGEVSGIPVGHDTPLSPELVAASDNLVGQMGVEPFLDVLEEEPDIIIAGRACDNAVIGSYPVSMGFPKGLALHMGSILECADFAAKPKPGQADSLRSDSHATVPILGEITEDRFTIRPVDDRLQCTEQSIAAHTLYEREDPRRSSEPGGVLDVSDCEFTAIGDDAVEVTGSTFIKNDQYTIKLEGAGVVGHRVISMAGVRDPALIQQIDEILERLRTATYDRYRDTEDGLPEISFRVYGKNGVMGSLEPEQQSTNHELGVLTEVIAETPQAAKEICGTMEMRLFHGRYEKAPQSGAVALPFSPNTFSVGEAAELTVYHTIPVKTPTKYASTTYHSLGKTSDMERAT